MSLRTKLEIAAAVLVCGVAFGPSAVRALKSPAAEQAAEPVAPAVVADTPSLGAGEYLYEGAKYTRLSTDVPDGVPTPDAYGGFARSAQAAIPVDTEPAIWSNNWMEGLSAEQVKMYAQGLVRSGLEDLQMCRPGYTCHGTVNYRVYEQNRSDLPNFTTLQASFTTPTQHREMFLLVQDGRGKVWFNNGTGWDYNGVVEELPDSDRNVVYKLMCSSNLDDTKY